jgi:hypothetical protein
MADLVTYRFTPEFAEKDDIHNNFFPYSALISIDHISELRLDLDTFNSRLDKRLIRRAKELGRLTSLLRAQLPAECDGHYHVANIQGRTVVIMTDSPVWTTRLRQLGPQILMALHQDGRKSLLHIRVFSRPSQALGAKRVQARKPQPKWISPQSSQLIHQAAACIDDDKLRQALHQLATHTAPKKPEN